MKLTVYYDRPARVWVAFYSDSIGQLGDCEYHVDRDLCVFNLGCEYGRNPQKFSRSLGEYFAQEIA